MNGSSNLISKISPYILRTKFVTIFKLPRFHIFVTRHSTYKPDLKNNNKQVFKNYSLNW